MKKTWLLTALILFFVTVFWTSVPVGCANIIPPAGGPRDSLPPRLLKANPPDSSVNFRGKEIVLDFDEYVDLKDVSNNLLFMPTFERNPEIKAHARTLTIKFSDSLQPNTTYVLNFGNAITDIHESNVLKNFSYAFSTGSFMDSLELSGRVVLAETGGIDSTLIVVLHKDLTDSAVIKKSPQYLVRLDRNGAFRFRYLPADTFAIYAIGDAAMSKKYQNKNQLFAFANAPVVAGKSDSILLYAYRETAKAGPSQAGGGVRTPAVLERRLRFTPRTTGQQDLMGDYVLDFPVPLKSFDSTKIKLTTDSSFQAVGYTALLDSARKELHIATAWKENTRYNLVLAQDFASDTAGRQLLKTDTILINTKKTADYGSLSIRIRNLDTARNPVLLFIQNGRVVQSASIRSGLYTNNMFNPGEYELRILYDTNDNKQWDPGQFFGTKRQPELVVPIEQKITVKPAWENEFERAL